MAAYHAGHHEHYEAAQHAEPMCCCCCIMQVKQGTVGVVETMGSFDRVQDPGPSWVCCPFQTVAGTLSTRVQQLDVHTDSKTKDNVTMELKIAVQYQVIDAPMAPVALKQRPSIEGVEGLAEGIPEMDRGDVEPKKNHGVYRAFYELTDIRRQLTPYVEDVVRSEIPKRTLDEAYESKAAVAQAVKDSLSAEMTQYGYKIVNTLVTEISPDKGVMKAMNDIETNRRQRQAMEEQAEAKKILVVKAAEAEMEAKELSGRGVALQRKAIVDGLKESVVEFNHGVDGTTPADVMQLMMVTQYLDMLKDVGHGQTTIMIPHGPGALQDVQSQMRNGFLEANLMGAENSRPVAAEPARP